MSAFATLPLPARPTLVAPDGSDVRVLLRVQGASMAHFELAAGKTSQAIVHRTVEEVWYVLAGEGEMWRAQNGREEIVALRPGVCLTIPLGTRFQFRASVNAAVSAVAVTVPPWPGPEEATVVQGAWR